jgi:hypothetical protein
MNIYVSFLDFPLDFDDFMDEPFFDFYIPKFQSTTNKTTSYKTTKFSNIMNITPNKQTCSICFDDFEENDDVSILKCNHLFHYKCINKWLMENKTTCPICRKNFLES